MASNGGLIEQFCSVNRSDRLGEPLSVLRPPADSDKELCSVRIDGIIRGALRSSICAAGRTRCQSLVEAEIHITWDFRSRGQPTGAKRRNAPSCPDDSVICRHADLVGDARPRLATYAWRRSASHRPACQLTTDWFGFALAVKLACCLDRLLYATTQSSRSETTADSSDATAIPMPMWRIVSRSQAEMNENSQQGPHHDTSSAWRETGTEQSRFFTNETRASPAVDQHQTHLLQVWRSLAPLLLPAGLLGVLAASWDAVQFD